MSTQSPGIDFPWLRRIKVTFEGVSGGGDSAYECDGTQEKLRIIARIEKTIQSLPAATNIMIFNLSENSRKSFVWNRTKVRIEAGWQEGKRAGLHQCFYGTFASAVSQRAGADIVTSITAISAIDTLSSLPCNDVWGPGTPVKTIVERLASRLGVTVDPARIKGLDQMKVGKGGWTHSDVIRTAFERLSAEFGFSWTIADDTFQAVKDKKSLGGNTVIESPYLIDINPTMYGPGTEVTINGLKIRCTFNSTIMPGFDVQVKSKIEPRYNEGKYLVLSVVHNLDCFNANSFITEINARVGSESIGAINGI